MSDLEDTEDFILLILLKQETYKLLKRPSFTIFWLFLIVFQLAMAIFGKAYPQTFQPENLFLNDFYAPVLIVFYIIAVGSTQLSSENQYGTLKALLYRQYSSSKVLVSKWLTLLGCALCFYGSSFVMTFLLKVIFFQNKFSLTLQVSTHQPIWQAMLMNTVSEFLTLLFLAAFVLLLATLFDNSTPAIIVGISAYFVVSVFNQLMFVLIDQHDWLKWNPVNMLNFGAQLNSPKLSSLTHLGINQMMIGYIAYGSIFLILGLIVFRRRNLR